MVLSRTTEEIKSAVFSDIVHLLSPNDCLILNDTRVIPARLYGIKDETHANVEFLLLRCINGDLWECAARPAKLVKEGSRFTFGDGLLRC